MAEQIHIKLSFQTSFHDERIKMIFHDERIQDDLSMMKDSFSKKFPFFSLGFYKCRFAQSVQNSVLLLGCFLHRNLTCISLKVRRSLEQNLNCYATKRFSIICYMDIKFRIFTHLVFVLLLVLFGSFDFSVLHFPPLYRRGKFLKDIYFKDELLYPLLMKNYRMKCMTIFQKACNNAL